MDRHQASNYSRGRSGRPLQRIKGMIRREGTHVCWICHGPIDMELTQYTGRGMDWTLDHYTPLSRDDHGQALDPSNLREAHRRCNSARGTRVAEFDPDTSRRW